MAYSKKISPIYLLYLVLASLLVCACNVRDTLHYRGKMLFYIDGEIVSGPVSSEQFEAVKKDLYNVCNRFGFVEDKEFLSKDSYDLKKTNEMVGETVNVKGSDAYVTLVIVNKRDYFRIAITDWSYNYQTRFMKALINEMQKKLERNGFFSDVVFTEASVFILNN